MARNRYMKDYRLIEQVDERGRIHTDYEYIGERYRYVRDGRTVDRARMEARVLCAAGWLLFVGGLLPNSAAMRTIYISLPYIFAAIPLALLTETVFSAPAGDAVMERRKADRLLNRYPPAALALAVLAGVSLIGVLICLVRSVPLGGEDAAFSLCAAAVCAAGVRLFIKRRSFDTRRE